MLAGVEKTLAGAQKTLTGVDKTHAKVEKTPLDEARTAPIDRIGRAAAARLVRRVEPRVRDGVTPFSSGI
jgi:hypothetical protein